MMSLQPQLAPIVIFCFNRPNHVQKLLESLIQNEEIVSSKLYVFIDGPRQTDDIEKIDQTYQILKKYKCFFKETLIIKRKQNFGCKNNIISGITEIFENYERVIVLEDDLTLSKYFLKFTNDALTEYADSKDIWHISGYCSIITEYHKPEGLFTRGMNCWGWATWKDRWQHLNLDAQDHIDSFSAADIYHFNFNGAHDFYRQLTENNNKMINTWAIYWYATIYRANGLCLMPNKTLTLNHGNDQSGERSGLQYQNLTLCETPINFMPSVLEENKKYLQEQVLEFNKQKNILKSVIKKIIYILPPDIQKLAISTLIKMRTKILNKYVASKTK